MHDWADTLLKRTIAGVRIVKVLDVREDRVVCLGSLIGSATAVCIEVMPDELGEAQREHVHEEMRRAASVRDLHSSHVAAVLDLGHVSDCYYIVSEQRPSTLARLLERKTRLSVRQALTITESLLQGLVALESVGVVHGNVTPSGVLLGHDGTVCLARPGAVDAPDADLPSLGAMLRTMLGDADNLPASLHEFAARLVDSPPGSAQKVLDDLRAHAEEWLGRRAALPGRMVAAMRRTALWTCAAGVLLLATLVPAVLMIGECRSSTPDAPPPAPAPTLSPWPSVELTVQTGAAAPLTTDQALAVNAVLQTALDWHPAFELDRGADASLIAPFVMTATSVPGHGKREWTLTLTRKPDGAQGQVRCDVRTELAPLEAAVWKLLDRAAAAKEGAAESAAEPTPADAVAWAHMARALAAERAGDLPGAVAHVSLACTAAPDAGIFAVMHTFLNAASFENFSPLERAPVTHLPKQLRAFQDLLASIAQGAAAQTETQFADYLATYPRCVRGYYLLGLWRQHDQNRTADAEANFRRAAAIDPGYGPVKDR